MYVNKKVNTGITHRLLYNITDYSKNDVRKIGSSIFFKENIPFRDIFIHLTTATLYQLKFI